MRVPVRGSSYVERLEGTPSNKGVKHTVTVTTCAGCDNEPGTCYCVSLSDHAVTRDTLVERLRF